MLLRNIILKLAQVLVFIALQKRVKVTEAGEGRHKIDKSFPAVAVKLGYLVRGQRLLPRVDFFILLEIEAVLNIKLQRVDFIERQLIR